MFCEVLLNLVLIYCWLCSIKRRIHDQLQIREFYCFRRYIIVR